jgi:hypothetical protein
MRAPPPAQKTRHTFYRRAFFDALGLLTFFLLLALAAAAAAASPPPPPPPPAPRAALL